MHICQRRSGSCSICLIPLVSCAALSETWLDFLDSKIVQGAKFYGVSEFFKVLEFYKIVQSRKWFYGNLTLDEDALFLQGLAPSAPKKINPKPNSGNLLQILSERTRGLTDDIYRQGKSCKCGLLWSEFAFLLGLESAFLCRLTSNAIPPFEVLELIRLKSVQGSRPKST